MSSLKTRTKSRRGTERQTKGDFLYVSREIGEVARTTARKWGVPYKQVIAAALRSFAEMQDDQQGAHLRSAAQTENGVAA